MKWETMKLSDCCASIADGDHQPPPKSEQGVPFVTIANINSYNEFDFNDTMFVPQEYYDRLDGKRKAQNGDVLYSVVGSFGIPVLIKDTTPFVFQRHIAILRPDTSLVLPEFLYYTMLSRDFYAKADAVALGAAQRTISLTSLRNIRIDIPAIDYQKKIVSILSSYDHLINNNQKQIKLLEEAAQRLYKEWFINLRFPGHETTPIVNGVPEGWKKGMISEIVEYYDKIRKPLSSIERKAFQGKYKYYGAAGVLDHVKEFLYDGTFLLMGEDGTVITPYGTPVLQYVSGKFWVNNLLKGKKPYSTEFVYMMFNQLQVKDIVTGVAQPKISQARLSQKGIIIPSIGLVLEYSKKTDSIFKSIILLSERIEILQQARNRLLPKLMSGEIEV